MLKINRREADYLRSKLGTSAVKQTHSGRSKTYFIVEDKRNLAALKKYRESIKVEA